MWRITAAEQLRRVMLQACRISPVQTTLQRRAIAETCASQEHQSASQNQSVTAQEILKASISKVPDNTSEAWTHMLMSTVRTQATQPPAAGVAYGVLAALSEGKLAAPPPSEDPRKRRRQQLAMIHYTLRTDLPAFFVKQMTHDIYSPDILFEESVSSIGLSCHGHQTYRRLLSGLRSLARLVLQAPQLDVHSCIKHDTHGEIHVRWSVRGRWRVLGRPYALEAMSVYIVNDQGLISYHRCDRVQRDMTRNPNKAGLLAKLFPDPPEYTPIPTCTACPPPQ